MKVKGKKRESCKVKSQRIRSDDSTGSEESESCEVKSQGRRSVETSDSEHESQMLSAEARVEFGPAQGQDTYIQSGEREPRLDGTRKEKNNFLRRLHTGKARKEAQDFPGRTRFGTARKEKRHGKDGLPRARGRSIPPCKAHITPVWQYEKCC